MSNVYRFTYEDSANRIKIVVGIKSDPVPGKELATLEINADFIIDGQSMDHEEFTKRILSKDFDFTPDYQLGGEFGMFTGAMIAKLQMMGKTLDITQTN